MTARMEDINVLIIDAKELFESIKTAYAKASAASVSVDPKTRLDVKKMLESLRSALDFLARKIRERVVSESSVNDVFFPITRKGAKPSDFASILEKKIPGLHATGHRVIDTLRRCQPFTSPDNSWLIDFNTICNEVKHERFLEDSRADHRALNVLSSEGERVLAFGSGVTSNVPIRVGSTVIGAQTPLWGSQGAIPDVVNGRALVVNWSTFTFDTIGEKVDDFLERAISGVEAIVSEVKRELER